MATNDEPDLTGYSLEGYLFKKHLGSGAFGAVWLCEQPALDRHVAIKVLKRTGTFAEARFMKEARLASKLDHPNAAHVYAFGVAPPPINLWIAMEYIPGVALDKWLAVREHVVMTPEQFVPFFRTLAEVVQAAHDQCIVHRDLKPSNVMVVERQGSLVPKLLDLGIAREGVHPATLAEECSAEFHDEDRVAIEALAEGEPAGEGLGADVAPKDDIDAALPAVPADAAVPAPRSTADAAPSARPPDLGETHRGVGAGAARGRLTPLGGGFHLGHLGTRHYMPPEQWANPSDVGHESDQYALAVIAFQCLVGRVPFHAEDPRDLHLMHLTRPVPSLGAAFSAEVDAVLRRALAKFPSERYATVTEFAEALVSALRRLPQRQLTSLSQVWDDAGRPPSLVLNGSELLQQVEPRSEIERDFLAASHEHVTRSVRRRVVLTTLAATCVTVIGALSFGSYLMLRAERGEQKARVATAVAETTITQAHLEQGRSELLHHEPGAAANLANAYQRDPQPSTAFMLSRALQPLLAERARFESTFGRMWSAGFSPDGMYLVTSDDKNAQIWDVRSSKRLFMLPHGDIVFQAHYSSDGSQVITSCGDGAVRIWSSSTGVLLREFRHGTLSPRYYAVSMSRSSGLIAAIDLQGSEIHVWELATGVLRAELHNSGMLVPSIAFSSDGRWLATSGGVEVRVFDTRTWTSAITIKRATRFAWEPNGSHLLTGHGDGEAAVWSIPDRTRSLQLRNTGEVVDAVAFSPNGRLGAVASHDGTVQVWDTLTGKLQSQGNFLRGVVRSLDFDLDSNLVAAAGGNASIAIIDAKQGTLVSLLDGPRNPIVAVRFSPVSNMVVGASWDETARIWDASAPYRRWGFPAISSDCGGITGQEPEQRFVVIDCRNHPVSILDTTRGQLVAELPRAHAGADFTPGLSVVSVTGDRAAIAHGSTVEEYELLSAKMVDSITHPASVTAVAFAGFDQELVSGSADGSLLVTHRSGAVLTLPKMPAAIDAAAIAADGRVVAADAKRHLRVFETNGVVVAEFELASRVLALRISSNSRYVLTLSTFAGGVVAPQLWDIAQRRPVAQLSVKGQGRVYSGRFVAPGQIVTACGDGAARLWDAESGRLIQTYEGGARFLTDATLSSDGAMMVGGDGDGLLRFWDAASGRPLWTMPAHASHVVGIHIEGDDIVTRGFLRDIARWTLPKPARVIADCVRDERCATVLP